MINYNGQLVTSETFISPFNRGLNYGDALFETMRFSHGEVHFQEDHYFRLMASMRILRMEIPSDFTMEFFLEEIQKIVADDDKNLRIKILVWRREGGKFTPTSREVDYLISKESLDDDFYSFNTEDYEVELFKDFYVQSGLLSSLKTNNRIINVVGSIYAEENEYNNCLLLNEHKNVVEALNANIFLVFGNHIVTPPVSDGCINGIMRKQLLKIIAAGKDFTIEERSVSPFELQRADEMFLTNVIKGIQPVRKYRKKEYSSEVSQKLTERLNSLFPQSI